MTSYRPVWERVLPLGVLATTLMVVPYLIWSDSGLPKLNRLRAERDGVFEKVSRLEQQITQLRAEVERVKSDPSAVEQAARDELGLVRQTDVVFQFQR
jgi:cell division protein FtsB